MSITIVTPTYNRALLISRTIESILAQTSPDWKLIIVDDGSTDNTVAMIEPFLSDARIRLITKDNTGAADSRNRAAQEVETNYITFLDSDDVIFPEWLFTFQGLIGSGDFDLAFCGSEIYDDRLMRVSKTPKPIVNFSFFEHRVNFLAGAFWIKSALFREIGGFNKLLPAGHHSDIELKCIRIDAKRKLSSCATDQVLVRIFRHSGEKIRSNPAKVIRSTEMLLNEYSEIFRKARNKQASYMRVLAREYKKLGDRNQQRHYLVRNAMLNPFSVSNYLRILRTYF